MTHRGSTLRSPFGGDTLAKCGHCGDAHPASATFCPMTGLAIGDRSSSLPPSAEADSFSENIREGMTLDQKFLLRRCLGKGGMGVVYEATHLFLDRKVAIKFVRWEEAFDPDSKKRFLREGRNLAALTHPNIVQIFDLGFTHEIPYLVMEHLAGESLEDRIEREGPRSLADVLSIGRQVLRALIAVHEIGVVHRDLKPANIFLVEGPNDPNVRLLDFGLSYNAFGKDSDPVIAGTPEYLSPEQARGEVVDMRTDLYSLGATLYTAVTGKLLFSSPVLARALTMIQTQVPASPSSIVPGLPRDFDAFILRLLEKDPNARFGTARETLDALHALGAVANRGAAHRYVLIADADTGVAASCARSLHAPGHDVKVCHNAQDVEAFLWKYGWPRLFLVGFPLPGSEGLDLLVMLRDLGSEGRCRVIAACPSPSFQGTLAANMTDLGIVDVLPSLAEADLVQRAVDGALT